MDRCRCAEADICRAARDGEIVVVRFLLDSGLSVDSCDTNGDSLLVCLLKWQCNGIKRKEKKRQLIKQLINSGVCVNSVNSFGEWTLHAAVRGCVYGYVARKTVKRLVRAGSLVALLDGQGLSPANIAFNGGAADVGEYLLFQSIEQESMTIHHFQVIDSSVRCTNTNTTDDKN